MISIKQASSRRQLADGYLTLVATTTDAKVECGNDVGGVDVCAMLRRDKRTSSLTAARVWQSALHNEILSRCTL